MKTISLLAVAGALALPSVAHAASNERLIVTYRTGTSTAAHSVVRQHATVALLHRLRYTDSTEVVLASPGDKERLEADPAVASVVLDSTISLLPGENPRPGPSSGSGVSAFSNDEFFGLLWGLENTGQEVHGDRGTPDADIDGSEAWAVSTGAGATVYEADTGIDYTHPDLAANYAGGYDFVDSDSDPMDEQYHGTHVAGTIAAIYSNGIGVAGVAPNAKLKALRVLDRQGQGWFSDFMDAISYAGKEGARIFTASLGGSPDQATVTAECNLIASYPNTLFTFAAGNGGSDGIGDNNDVVPNYPSNCQSDNIIAVAASDQNDRPTTFSNYGFNTVDVAAPGANIGSTAPGGGYIYLDGTSMATPHVAGEAALLASEYPTWTAAQIRQRILTTVDLKPAWQGLIATGGRINAAAAVAPMTSPPNPPTPNPPTPNPPTPNPPTPNPPTPKRPARDVTKPHLSGVRLTGAHFPVKVHWIQDKVATVRITLTAKVRGHIRTMLTMTVTNVKNGAWYAVIKRGHLKRGRYCFTVRVSNQYGYSSSIAGFRTIKR